MAAGFSGVKTAVFDPQAPHIWYAGAAEWVAGASFMRVLFSNDSGQTWEVLPGFGDLPGEAIEDMAVNPITAQVLAAFVAQHYAEQVIPPLLLLSEPLEPVLLQALSEQAGHKIQAVTQPRGQRKIWLDMAEQGAALQLARLLAEEQVDWARVRRLVEAIGDLRTDMELLTIHVAYIEREQGKRGPAGAAWSGLLGLDGPDGSL